MARKIEGGSSESAVLQSAGLAAGFHLMVESSSTFSNIEKHSTSLPLIYAYCEELSRSPQIMRVLTDLHHYSFSDFQRALFCSWFSVCFSRFLNLDHNRVHDLFCAGLMQDVGKCLPKLDLSDWVSDFRPEPSRYENFHGVNDAHPLIASSFIEQHFEEYRDVKDLVLHHHARADGLGYPEGVVESFLSLDDQILILANDLYDRLRIEDERLTLEEALVQLKVASYFYFKNTHNECVRFLKMCLGYSDTMDASLKDCGAKESWIDERTQKKLLNLSHCVLIASELNRSLAPFRDEALVAGLRQFIEKLTFFAFDQGVINQSSFELSEQSLNPNHLNRGLLLKSIQYHLNDYERYLDNLIGTNQYESLISPVTKAIASLSLCISSPKLQ